MKGNGSPILDRFPDRVLVKVALLVVDAEDFESTFAVLGLVYRRDVTAR